MNSIIFFVVVVVLIICLIVAILHIRSLYNKYHKATDLITQMSYRNPATRFEMSQDQHYFKIIALNEDNMLLELLGNQPVSNDLNFRVYFKNSALLGANLISKGKTFQVFFDMSLPKKFYFREIK